MLRLCLAVLLTLLLSTPSAALPFTDLFVFGDSIVDVGNTQTIAGGPGSPNDPTPASAGYFDGRFTNGINPADVMNQAIEGTNSTHSLAGGDNFSFGGARARDNSVDMPPLQPDAIPDIPDAIPDIATQVGRFATARPVVDPNALYVVNIGANDVFDALALSAAGSGQSVEHLEEAADATVDSVLTLQSLGAQHILFMGVGDVGATPAVKRSSGLASGRTFSETINASIQEGLPNDVFFLDTIALFDQVLMDPAAFGLPTNLELDSPCLGSGVPDPAGPPTCEQFAFFDPIHPTTQVLQIVGDEAVSTVGDETISTIPEPTTVLLLVLGLAALAPALRGRQTRAQRGEGERVQRASRRRAP